MKATVNGAKIFFDVEGTLLKPTPTEMKEKPVCVILHGGPGGDHSSYRPWLAPLSEYMQLIYVDHRGTGRSGKVPQETLKVEQFADDLEALRKTLGIPKWNVLGCSFGGMWALTYAVRHQKSIDNLILLDTTACWKEDWKAIQKTIADWANADQKRVYKDVFDGKITTPKASAEWYKIMLPLYVHHYSAKMGREFLARGRGSAETSAYMWKNVMSDYDLRSELAGIHVPTMIMVGTHDWVTPISQSRYLAKHISGAKLVVFHESGHMVYIDENEKFLRNMKQFLKLK